MSKAISMKKTSATNPARCGFVSITSNSNELGYYLRKVNAIENLSAQEEKELAVKAQSGDNNAKKELAEVLSDLL